MITMFLVFFLLITHVHIVHSDCPFIDVCNYNRSTDQVICDGGSENQSDTGIPSLNCVQPATNYFFSNFKVVQTNAFENDIFLPNCSINMHLANIEEVRTEAFSSSMIIPLNSTLSIVFENSDSTSGLTLDTNAFNGILINHLRFSNINSFNGKSIFNTGSLGPKLHVEKLIFESSSLTGFISDTKLEQPTVDYLCIRNCPSLKNLSPVQLPSFLQATKTLEISGTGLQSIDPEIFRSWNYTFETLLIKNNINLNVLPQIMVGPAKFLNTLDLSNNSITSLSPSSYDWSPYSNVKNLILKQQPALDLFIKSDILKSTSMIKTIDFSNGIISINDGDLILNHVPSMPNLASINISHTNFTDSMVIDLLTKISNSANQTIQVSLLGHALNDSNFCSYYQIFKQAPNSLSLEVDRTHKCNCIIDLFYDKEHSQLISNDSLIEPTCVLNFTRARCNIGEQLTLSQCPVGEAKADVPDDSDIGTLAFTGTMVGLAIVLLALLALSSRVIYRARRGRFLTILDMEDPGGNVVDTTVDRPLEASTSRTMEAPVENAVGTTVDGPLEVSTSQTMEAPVENAVDTTVDGSLETSTPQTVEEPL